MAMHAATARRHPPPEPRIIPEALEEVHLPAILDGFPFAPQAIDAHTFQRLADLIYEKAGIRLGPHKQALVCTRVGKRMRQLGIDGFRDYYAHLQADTTGAELVELLNSISTNVTSFFRESRHFDFLGPLLRRWEDESQTRFRIWSAACSTGEEPYSIAITIRESLRRCVDAKVLATDISTRAIRHAREASYAARHVDAVPRPLLLKYFARAPDRATYTVRDEIRDMVTFGRINLSKPPFPLKGPLDVVFCRNVMIYFDNEVRRRLLAELFRLIRPGGYLLVGHAESLAGMISHFKTAGPSIYLRP